MANDLAAALKQEAWRRLDVAAGMPPAQVRAIAQDAQGFMWFGTEAGLLRYDGNELRLFLPDPNRPQSLSHEAINTLRVDTRNRLWIGTERGLDRWDPATESFVHILSTSKTGPPRKAGIFTILPAADGSLWLGDVDCGLLHLDPETGKFLSLVSSIINAKLYDRAFPKSLLVDSHGVLWIGTDQDGLACYSPETRTITWWHSTPNAPGEHCGRTIEAIVEDSAGRIWVASESGLCVINPERTRLEGVPLHDATPGSSHITSLVLGRSGGLWMGSDNAGLRLLDPVSRAFTTFRSSELDTRTLSTDWVTALFEDANGDLWTGHTPSGVSFLNSADPGFRIYQRRADTSATLSQRSVNSFLETADGAWWIGTDGGGLNRHMPGTDQWTHFVFDPNDPTSLSSNSVLCLAQDQRGMVWVGTWNGGINRLDPATGKFRRYDLSTGPDTVLSANRVWRLMVDSQQRLWAATVIGLRRYNPATDSFDSIPLPLGEGVAPVPCSALEEGADGSIWTNTAGMLFRLRPGESGWEKTTFEAGSIIWGIKEDQSGRIWLASFRNGLFRYDPLTGQSRNYRVADGLPHNSVLSVTEDANHFIWMGTAKGLCRLDPSTDRVHLFDQDAMLHSGFFSRGASGRTSDGGLVFGSYNGFVVVQPAIISRPSTSHPLLLTELSLSNRIVRPGSEDSPLSMSITETPEITVPSDTPSIGFRFSLLSYRMPERVRYEYQLEGLDATWRSAGPERNATYTHLKPGTYRFRLRAGHLGDGSPQDETSVVLVITPAWWERTSVRTAALLAVIALALASGWRVAVNRNRVHLREMQHQHALAVERHAAEKKARELEDRLAQAQKMESIGRLAGGVAHDFNNMLQAILGNAAIALEEAPDTPALREPLDEISKAARRSADLTRQLLAFARQQAIRPVALDLNETVAGMLKMLQRLVDANIRLTFTPGAGLWTVKIDPSQVDQILANLVVNAHHAIAGQGTITIVTANFSIDALYAETHVEAVPGDYVVLSVGDTGSGMTAETKAHLFEPFFTTKAVGKGTGLGLATVYGIVKQNRGFINVYSEPGQGAMFRIHLPRCREAAALAAPVAPSAPPRGHETILLVEDEPQILAVCQRTLERLGYRVLAAGDPTAAAAIAAGHAGQVHLLLTDIIMPTMNGHELLQSLRRSNPGLQCVFMSGYTADTFRQQGIIPEGVHFLAKPFTAESLATTIRAALDQPA